MAAWLGAQSLRRLGKIRRIQLFDKTGGPSITPSTDPGELKLAYAAAAAAAASETDPNKAAAAYTACLGAFGYI